MGKKHNLVREVGQIRRTGYLEGFAHFYRLFQSHPSAWLQKLRPQLNFMVFTLAARLDPNQCMVSPSPRLRLSIQWTASHPSVSVVLGTE